MKRVIHQLICFIIILFSTNVVQAQVVVAQVSSKQVQAGVPFEYAIVINTNPNSYSPPNFNGLAVVSGPNQSSSMQWVNGQTTTQLTLSWGLVAQKEGKYTIGAAAIMSGANRYETQPITIEVLKGAPQAGGGQSNDPQHSTKIDGSDLFIKTSTSKNKCYLGEQITITQKVYSRLQIVSFQKFAQPAYDGFYSQAQESTSKGVLQQENIDGVTYYTYEVFRTVATANQAGKISLTPIEGEVIVRRQSNAKPRNIFEQFLGVSSYEDIPVKTKSRSFAVEVLPLPEAGKPNNFKGAVGDFSYKVDVTRKELKANDAFNLKMTISGKGNLKLLSAPELKLPEGFETYEPKVSESANSKTFDFLVIPRQEGNYTLDGMDFSYFNLDSKKYITLPSGDIKINVLAPDPNAAGAQVYSSQSQIKETENDIRYIKKGNFALVKTETEFFNSFNHIALLIFPLLAMGAGLVVRRNHIKNNSNQILVRERKAARLAKKQLVNAEKLVSQNKKDEFYTEILTALNNYLSHKLNIPVSDLSRDTVNKTLLQKQVDEQVLIKLLATIETSEYAKYAPGAVSGDLQSVYKDTVELITGLEQQLNKKA
jgi:hypothetical protein